MAGWELFCGKTFFVTNNGTLEQCFRYVALSYPCLGLLAVTSAYFIAKRFMVSSIERQTHQSSILSTRLAVTLLLALCPIIRICCLRLFTLHPLNFSDFVWLGVSLFGWGLHTLYILVLKMNLTGHTRGPLAANLNILFTLITVVIDFHAALIGNVELDVFNVEFSMAAVSIGLHLIYFVTLIPKGDNLRLYELFSVTDPSMQQNLTDSTSHSYGTFETYREAFDLGVAEDDDNFFSILTFWWVRPLMQKGYKGLIKDNRDLYDLPLSLNTHNICSLIETKYETVKQNQLPIPINGPVVVQRSSLLFSILLSCFGCKFYSIGVVKFMADACSFGAPILLNYLIVFLEAKDEPISKGFYLALGLALTSLAGSLFSVHFNYLTARTGIQLRTSVISLIYRKTLLVHTSCLNAFSAGEIVNFMSTDSDKIVNFCQSFHQFWSLPIQVLVVLYLLHQQIGISFLSGLVYTLLLIPINRFLAKKIANLSLTRLNCKDKRIKIMNETLSGMRSIKMHSWEELFSNKIQNQRNEELKSLKKRQYLDAFCVYFWASTPVIISVSTFITYVLLGNELTAAKVFTCLALFRMLVTPLNAFPYVINGIIEAWISLNRVENFLKLPDFKPEQYYSELVGARNKLEITDGYFVWATPKQNLEETYPGSSFTLGPLDVAFRKGQFIGILGPVGSGKSSFLSAVLSDLLRERGTVAIDKSDLEQGIGYLPQEPWIQTGSIQFNILFGKPMNFNKYQAVVGSCALLDDFEVMSAGDQTQVGEKGVALSGGQKARISLARAIYQDFDMYLLDDPFSAVDNQVGEHIYQQCMRGILSHKTLIICTHHLRFLRDAEHVVVLNKGRIQKQGDPKIILSQDQFFICSFEDKDKREGEKPSSPASVLLNEEEKEIGRVKFSVYLAYAKALGPITSLVVLFSLILMQGSKVFSDWWLTYWVTEISGNSTSNHTRDESFYIGVYSSTAFANSFFTFVRAFAFAYGGVSAAVHIHQKLLETVTSAPCRFFETTPLGQLLNRFSSDLNMVDDSLPFILNIFLAQVSGVLATIFITSLSLPWMLLVYLPIFISYFYVQNYYRHTSREVKRLSNISLSPLYEHFTETLNGLNSIRAMGASSRFCNINEALLGKNQRAVFANIAAAQWLDLNLQLMGVAVISGVGVLAILEHQYSPINPAMVGLAITYALSTSGLLSGMVSSFTEVEKEMVSVERIAYYLNNIKPERMQGIIQPAISWPVYGVISFDEVCLRYQVGHQLALKGVSFETRPGEKIGIVGRTGSGKTSLFQALFRMVELEGGRILLDGVNVAHLNLKCLRSQMAVIPQDPFLFAGNVRHNLDPEGKHEDGELWRVLRQCYLYETVYCLGGLTAQLGEKGQGLSSGQKQQICLARALLSRAKVLCIDEATASMDLETDRKIQKTLKEVFKQTTVLTIAHRLETVMDSDRLLVLSKGRLVETGNSQELSEDSNSHFYRFLQEGKL